MLTRCVPTPKAACAHGPSSARILGSFVLLAAASPAAAVERPFWGRIVGHSEIHPSSNPEIYVGSAQAVGLATHVGAFSKVTDDAVNVTNGWTVGSFTMTAANGDLLTGDYEGFVVTDFLTGTFMWSLDAMITGGTGRFAGAAGAFEFIAAGEFVVLPGRGVATTYEETFRGTIDY